ncbi:phospholipid scramblase 2 [Lepeophtheirus salmonis]|uniref:phospholipid scramblase 2 n=1 Tax=Lepeophtheirus salmonis TaxID=72036 RepID=UPI001AEA687C|nr:phospholipid scramblase 2-like [Lepeophtheirus salmonis]
MQMKKIIRDQPQRESFSSFKSSMAIKKLMIQNYLQISQKIDWIEVISPLEISNSYSFRTESNEELFIGTERSEFMGRNCCEELRALSLNVYDTEGNEVLVMKRPFNCNRCCFPCCLQRMDVFDPSGIFIGSVNQVWTLMTPKFKILDRNHTLIYEIIGPCLFSRYFRNVDFGIFLPNGYSEVGKLSKQFDLIKDIFTDADILAIRFPTDSPLEYRLILMAALFLIDYNYYEGDEGRRLCWKF